MKKILALQGSGNVPGPISALIKAVHLPHPESPDKQRVTFTDGQADMDCNIYGKHLHIPHEKVGDVVKISFTENKAAYLTVFPDGGRCLTLRDGVTYSYRAPKEGTVPTSEDRIVAMARHYALCFQNAQHQLQKVCPGITPEVVQPVATVLFIDTKHTVKVVPGSADNEPLWSGPPKQENPPAPVPEPEPTPEPAPPPDGGEPSPAPEPQPEATPEPEKPQAPVALTDSHRDTLLNMKYPAFLEKMRGALCYYGDDAMKLAWRDLFISVADNYQSAGVHPKVWLDLYDEIWQSSKPSKQKVMDDMIAEIIAKRPDTTDKAMHRAIAIYSNQIPNDD